MWLIISYWIFPVIASGMWLATMLTLLIRWAVDDFPHYPSMEPNQDIAYISDVGAQGLKPLFITGAVITGVFFDLAFISERWLRHRGLLLRNKGRFDKALAVLSIIFAILGTIGLILLSIFDTYRYPRQHNGMLVLFMGGYLLSAVFVCLEYLRLGITYRSHRILAVSFSIKLLFIIVELALAIAFGVTTRGERKNQAAVIEWVIAYIFTFYILSFIIDLLPSIRTRHHVPQGERLTKMAEAGRAPGQGQDQGHRQETSSSADSAPAVFSSSPAAARGDNTNNNYSYTYDQDGNVTYEQPLTTDSMGDAANTYRGYTIDTR